MASVDDAKRAWARSYRGLGQRVLGSAALLQGVREVRGDQEAERVAVVASSEVATDSLVTTIESAGRYTATPVEPADG